MCGRFSLTATNDELNQRFGLVLAQNLRPRWNVAPSQNSLILKSDGLAMTAYMAQFGFSSLKTGKRLINARSETIAEKPSFAPLLAGQRCLVIASGWFEWSAPKVPWHIQLADGRVMAMAGLYRADKKGTPSEFVIATTAADGRLSALHHRCPAVLPASQWSSWLHGDIPQAVKCLTPPQAEFFNSYRVHPEVGAVASDHAGLVAPYEDHPSQPHAAPSHSAGTETAPDDNSQPDLFSV